ncbi:MAG: hypothetical protein GY731_12485, partial [Gammaproteobacteria bacterium]|nr:hypothetical protein [Gammaproteobacteria bacterium]
MKKKKTYSKKAKSSRVTKLPARRAQGPREGRERKLSELIDEMAMSIKKDPDGFHSRASAEAVLVLAEAAWNSTVDDTLPGGQHKIVDQIDWEGETPWDDFCSNDTERLFTKLVEYKRERYPNDFRRIVGTEVRPGGNYRVHWQRVERKNVVTTKFQSTSRTVGTGKAKRGHPIAEKLVVKMKKHSRDKVIDLKSVIAGRANAEELQKTVATPEDLAEHHPAHAAYVYAQNQVSVMSEQLTELPEMARFAKLLSKAEDEYLPSGPPMSPLTPSFFTCWAFFDAGVGLAEETIGTTAMAVGAAFGSDNELLRVMGLMQQSRMGIYLHEGNHGDTVMLRELVTDALCQAIVPAGYLGRKGELWYARVLPPPLPGGTEHVVFTTPYLLINPGMSEWQAYFRRTLPDAPPQDRIATYERHMKFGPARDYWTEFVFEAYVNHRTEVIFLEGLPDVPES